MNFIFQNRDDLVARMTDGTGNLYSRLPATNGQRDHKFDPFIARSRNVFFSGVKKSYFQVISLPENEYRIS
jgi:hypothetical protein